MNRFKHLFALYIMLLLVGNVIAQDTTDVEIKNDKESDLIINYKEPKKYTINKFDIIGSQYFDKNIIRSITGIFVEQELEIPGDEIAKAVKTLWKQGLFTDIEFRLDNVQNGRADLILYVVEKPRMSNYFFKGIKKGQAEDISKKITNLKGRPITPSLENTIKNTVQDFYKEKGYLSPEISFSVVNDTSSFKFCFSLYSSR
jgi:outer membrane protein insertion porin family